MTFLLWLRANWQLSLMLALGIALAVQSVRLADTKTDLAEEVAAGAKERQAYAERARHAVEKFAAQKAAHAAAQQEIVHAYNQERHARLAADAGRRAADQRLREQIRDFAGGGAGAGTDAAACRSAGDRAATLGLLLEDALGTAGTLAEGAERHADEVRLLKRLLENDRAGRRPIDLDAE